MLSDNSGLVRRIDYLVAINILFVAMKLLLQKKLIVVIKISRKTSRMFANLQESLEIEVRI